MQVELLRFPIEEDWIGCKARALVTVGKNSITPPDEDWKRSILRAKHSPIRYQPFSFKLTGVPYWVSVHLCRHVHAQPYVRSQRNDRQQKYDRNTAPQNEPVDMIWDLNAEELITVCEKRLCRQASAETRQVVMQIRDLVLKHCPEFSHVLAPRCVRNRVCDEMFPCEYGKRLNQQRWDLPGYIKNGGNEDV